MPSIPKLRLKNRANEGLKVADTSLVDRSAAAAIEAGTKAIQTGITGASEIYKMKIAQEEKKLMNDNLLELQRVALDDKQWQEDFKAKNNGKITGFSAWKADKLRQTYEKMGDQFSDPKIRESFLASASNHNRKAMVFSYQDENRQVFGKVKDVFDESLATSVGNVTRNPSDFNGLRDFNVELNKQFDSLDEAIKEGSITPQQADDMRDVAVDKLGAERFKALASKGAYGQAMSEFNAYGFTSPEKRAAALRTIEAAESSRLRDKIKAERDAERFDKEEQDKLLAEQYEREEAILSDPTLDPATLEEKIMENRKLYGSKGVDFRKMRGRQTAVNNRFKSYTSQVEAKFFDPEISFSDKSKMLGALISYSSELDPTSPNRTVLSEKVKTLQRMLDPMKQKFINKKLKEVEKVAGKNWEMVGEFPKYMEKYDSLEIDERYDAAILDYREDIKLQSFNMSKGDKTSSGVKIERELFKIEDVVPLVNNSVLKTKMINKLAGYWTVNTDEAKEMVESRIEDAKNYLAATQEKEKLLSKYTKSNLGDELVAGD